MAVRNWPSLPLSCHLAQKIFDSLICPLQRFGFIPWNNSSHCSLLRSADGRPRPRDYIVLPRYVTDVVGEGPTLHVHPYDEIFTITEGRARFTVGDGTIDAEAGDVVLGPANIPHGYQNLGPGRLDSLDIHLSPERIQFDLARA
jgi:mannose-6-phosphate isomerase-like protein (cupin superfamily)